MAVYSDEQSKQERIAKATESTKETKTLKRLMEDISSLKIDSRIARNVEKKLKNAGYTGNINEKAVIAYKAVERAENNAKDFEVYRDTLGEKPKETVSVDLDAQIDATDILKRHFQQ